MRMAAIDCGTNSTRLLVSEDGTQALERRARVTRLGQGVDATGRLAPEALQRTLSVLEEYRGVLDALDVKRVRATATSAVRDAANRDEFLDPAEALVGARPEVLSGEEEGRLTFAGATAGLDRGDGPFLVLDIGGGSTELVVGTEEQAGIASVDMGCVRVTERFLHADPPLPEELSQAISVLHAYLEDVKRDVPAVKEAATLVGVAGTVTTMAAVEIGLVHYDPDRIQHFVLTRAAAEDVFRTLATEPRELRRHNPGLEEDRVDVIVGGAAILVTVMRHFGFDECVVSESDLLDGLVLSQLSGGA